MKDKEGGRREGRKPQEMKEVMNGGAGRKRGDRKGRRHEEMRRGKTK